MNSIIEHIKKANIEGLSYLNNIDNPALVHSEKGHYILMSEHGFSTGEKVERPLQNGDAEFILKEGEPVLEYFLENKWQPFEEIKIKRTPTEEELFQLIHHVCFMNNKVDLKDYANVICSCCSSPKHSFDIVFVSDLHKEDFIKNKLPLLNDMWGKSLLVGEAKANKE